MKVESPCGAADLLAAIIGKDPEIVRARYGLPTKAHYNVCLNCGKPTRYQMFCNRECASDYTWVFAECSGCGGLFIIRKSQLIARTKRDKLGMIFCGKVCYGRYAGKTYGFTAHGPGRHRLWNYADRAKVKWLTRLGLSQSQISNETGIPCGTIHWLLQGKIYLF